MFNKELIVAAVEKMPKEEFMEKFRAALDKSHIDYKEGVGAFVWTGLPRNSCTVGSFVNIVMSNNSSPSREYCYSPCDPLDTEPTVPGTPLLLVVA